MFLLVILPHLISAQQILWSESPAYVYIQDVIEVDGKDAAQLKEAARGCIVDQFPLRHEAIQSDGDNMIKGIGHITRYLIDLHFTVTVQLKDDRLRYTIDNIHYFSSQVKIEYDDQRMIKSNRKTLEKIGQYVHDCLSDAIAKKLPDDDW